MINYKNFLFGEEEQTIDNLREQNEQLKEILSIREQQLLSLVNANSSYSERMEHYVELAKKADADKEMIQNSEFWKMTKPVRLLTDILKKDKVSRFPEKIQFSATIQTFEDIVKYFERGDRKIILLRFIRMIRLDTAGTGYIRDWDLMSFWMFRILKMQN